MDIKSANYFICCWSWFSKNMLTSLWVIWVWQYMWASRPFLFSAHSKLSRQWRCSFLFHLVSAIWRPSHNLNNHYNYSTIALQEGELLHNLLINVRKVEFFLLSRLSLIWWCRPERVWKGCRLGWQLCYVPAKTEVSKYTPIRLSLYYMLLNMKYWSHVPTLSGLHCV